jgi:N-acetylmuramoyl-L-alanine amidase
MTGGVMSRMCGFLMGLALCLLGGALSAQGFSGLAHAEAEGSRLHDVRGGMALELNLSQGVPYRVFTLAEPDRLVIDFREVDWSALDAERFDQAEEARAVRFGLFRPGWSRMIVDLAQPMTLKQSSMRVAPETGAARLRLVMKASTRAAFVAASGAPVDPAWGTLPDEPKKPKDDGRLKVLIDPGHGGVDPGAVRGEVEEKNLMLLLAFDLRDALLRVDGVDVFLTREDDRFVSLERRVTIAHQVAADVFLSLHADVLTEGRASGAVVYTLSDKASDRASELLAERHDRADMLAGVDLSRSDDVIAGVLLDLARQETQPRAHALAKAIAGGLKKAGVKLNRHSHKEAAFSVLKAADIPSVLLEVGFLSNDRDLKNLSDARWRRRVADGLRDGIQAWMIADKAKRSLVRQ